MRVIADAASCSPAVASRFAKYDGDIRVPMLLGAQQHDHTRQRATHNIGMAVEPEEGGKLALERLQPTFPVRAKTRR
jgi:acetyl-CoA carboxylase alpha subunit